jgi:hypothetical protein
MQHIPMSRTNACISTRLTRHHAIKMDLLGCIWNLMEPISSCVCLANAITETSIKSRTNACISTIRNFRSSKDLGNNNQLASKS